MSSKKYQINLVNQGETWQADIVRRVTASETKVSRSQDGFSSKTEAFAWGQQQLKEFAVIQADRNQRRASKRSQ